MLTFLIPQSWKEIKLNQFEAALRAEEAEYDDPIDRDLAWLAAILDVDRAEVEALPIGELKRISNELQWIKHPKFNERIPRFFYCGGKLFEFTYDVRNITAGQYAELSTWMKDAPMMKLDKIMASVSVDRPFFFLKGKYDARTHAKRAELFRKHLSLAVIYPAALFFFRLFIKSMESMQGYLEKENRKLTRELLEMIREEITS